MHNNHTLVYTLCPPLYSVVYDHCTILLVDSSDVGTLIPSPVSVYTHPSRCSTGTPDNELLFTPSPNDLRYVCVSKWQFYICSVKYFTKQLWLHLMVQPSFVAQSKNY